MGVVRCGPMRARAVLFLVAAACGNKGYDAKACAQYKDAFLESCVDVCTKSVDRSTCSTRCAEALPKDATYGAKCLASGAPATSSK